MDSFFDMTNNEQIEAFNELFLIDPLNCPFEFPLNIYDEQDYLDNCNLLMGKEFFPRKDFNYNSNQTIENTREKCLPFYVEKQSMRGRKKKIKRDQIHNKYASDNIKRKILTHSINFIIDFINLVLNILGREEKFLKIKANFKQQEKKEKFKLIMQKNIGQILCQEISPKYKKYNKNTNKNVYENVINVPIIKKLLSENY